MEHEVEVSVHPGVASVPAADWDACAGSGAVGRAIDPFTTHRFLTALETSGSVGDGTGWTPCPLVVRQGGTIVAVAPLYMKTHSQGEYVFDHAWADAYQRAGGDYYPKLQCAVPFSPVNGRRLLTRQGYDTIGRAALLQAMQSITEREGFSSAHITFCAEDTPPDGWLLRVGEQFHWQNRGYSDFDAFLAEMTSRKRKALRKERAVAQAFGGTITAYTGNAIRPEHWDAMWTFYQDTGNRKWGRPYLTREFFDALHDMRDDVLLVLAERDGVAVAGALNLIGRDTLYGRYWGCIEDHPYLHFELCYHQAVDWAIDNGLSRVEAGAQGEHKLARGYMPVPTCSWHWIAHPGLRGAVAEFLEQERAAVAHDLAVMTDYGPFRNER